MDRLEKFIKKIKALEIVNNINKKVYLFKDNIIPSTFILN